MDCYCKRKRSVPVVKTILTATYCYSLATAVTAAFVVPQPEPDYKRPRIDEVLRPRYGSSMMNYSGSKKKNHQFLFTINEDEPHAQAGGGVAEDISMHHAQYRSCEERLQTHHTATTTTEQPNWQPAASPPASPATSSASTPCPPAFKFDRRGSGSQDPEQLQQPSQQNGHASFLERKAKAPRLQDDRTSTSGEVHTYSTVLPTSDQNMGARDGVGPAQLPKPAELGEDRNSAASLVLPGSGGRARPGPLLATPLSLPTPWQTSDPDLQPQGLHDLYGDLPPGFFEFGMGG